MVSNSSSDAFVTARSTYGAEKRERESFLGASKTNKRERKALTTPFTNMDKQEGVIRETALLATTSKRKKDSMSRLPDLLLIPLLPQQWKQTIAGSFVRRKAASKLQVLLHIVPSVDY
jgi:hypothetical protein